MTDETRNLNTQSHALAFGRNKIRLGHHTTLGGLPRAHSVIDHSTVLLLLEALLQKDLILNPEQSFLIRIARGQHLLAGLAHPVHDIPQIFSPTLGISACSLRA